MKSVAAIPTLRGIRVLVRVDYNVPIKGTRILDTRRIQSSYKTIDAILKKGGTPILLAHLGDGEESLKIVARFLSKTYKVLFVPTDVTDQVTKQVIERAQKGTVVLLENIRRTKGEEENQKSFVQALASLADYYVNDAFSVSHRRHASIIGIPRLLPSFAGFQLQAEVAALRSVLEGKAHPFLFMLGGAKFGTKIPLLERFASLADSIVISGAILNNFYKAAGFEVGKSVVEEGYEKTIKKLLKNPKLLLPTDVVVARQGRKITVSVNDVQTGDVISDIGPTSIQQIGEKIKKAKLVVWNGPTGWYEKGFIGGTVALANAIVSSRAKAVIGGGDTAAVLEKMLKKTPAKKNVFISTGGGATLDYLAKGTLPGIDALEKSKQV